MSDKDHKNTDPKPDTKTGTDLSEQASGDITSGQGFVMQSSTPPPDQNKVDNSQTGAPDTSTADASKTDAPKTRTPESGADKVSPKARKRSASTKSPSDTSSSESRAGAAADKKQTAGADDKTSPQKPAIDTAKQSPKLLALSALVIALSAAAASGYTFWQQKNQTDQMLTQLDARNDQLQAQLQRQAQALNRLQSLPTAAQKLEQKTQSLQQTQNEQRRNLQELAGAFAKNQGPKPSDWLQAEAEYLLRLANHRLQLEGDVAGAKTLLASADERLKKADNPALFAVRQAIANELAQLDSIDAPDRSGLYFKLSALEGQIDQLPLPMDPERRSAFQQTHQADAAEQSVWQTLWHEAKTLVVVRHRDEKITPLLPPEESLYLRHNLRLTLQQAQIALLKEEEQLFRTLLQQAADWVQTHFDQNATRTQSVFNTLNTLAGQVIVQVRPDISGSLNLLRDLQKQRFSSAVPVTEPAPETRSESASEVRNKPVDKQEAPAS